MSYYFREYPTDPKILQNLPVRRLWEEESEDDAEWAEALEEFYSRVRPVVLELVMGQEGPLTDRQREVIVLHFFCQLPQQEVADKMNVSQSTVSRHLFGTLRNNKTVGGAIQKLRKLCCERKVFPEVAEALEDLEKVRRKRYPTRQVCREPA